MTSLVSERHDLAAFDVLPTHSPPWLLDSTAISPADAWSSGSTGRSAAEHSRCRPSIA